MRDRISQALQRQDKDEVTVLSSLIEVQEELGYLPPESMPMVAEFTRASVNDVYGVATFYTHFRFTPPGAHTIEVCWGLSCHAMGASEIMQAVKEELGLEEEGTTPDSKFTWKRVACAAACSQGPVAILDEKVRGRLTPQSVVDLMHGTNGKI